MEEKNNVKRAGRGAHPWGKKGTGKGRKIFAALRGAKALRGGLGKGGEKGPSYDNKPGWERKKTGRIGGCGGVGKKTTSPAKRGHQSRGRVAKKAKEKGTLFKAKKVRKKWGILN